MKQIICMKWGTKYGSDYVNRLYSMVSRNITGPFRFICLTDDARELREEIEVGACPEVDIPAPQRNQGWRKVSLWAESLPDLEGDVLFLDLDIVITGNIDCFFDYPGDYCVMRNWTQPNKRIGNTSVFRFRVGSHPYLLDYLERCHHHVFRGYTNSQTYISDHVSEMEFWPDEWCCLFKIDCVPQGLRRWFIEPKLPRGTKIVAFPGVPNPSDALVGQWPSPWYKKFYKHIKPTSWVEENWC